MRIAAKANWRRDHSRVAVTPHGDEPESSIGKFSGGNFKVGTLEDLLRRCNPDKKYIGNSTKGNEILPSWTVSSSRTTWVSLEQETPGLREMPKK
jgi:hypothetical protein